MNRHERRAEQAKKRKAPQNEALLKEIMSFPMIPEGESGMIPGRLTHIVMRHDDWCPALNEGGTTADCICNPVITRHLQPKSL
jgi:hypothetical protein